MKTAMSPVPNLLLRLSAAAVLLHLAAHALSLVADMPGVAVGPAPVALAACLAAIAAVMWALRSAPPRLPQLILSGGLAAFALGLLTFFGLHGDGAQTFPLATHLLSLPIYACTAAALILSARGLRCVRVPLWLDGVIAGAAVMSVGSLVFGRLLLGSEDISAALLIYPILDLVVLGLLVVALAASRPPGGVAAGIPYLMAAFGALLASDTANVFGLSHGAYVPGGLGDEGWAIGAICIALALRRPLSLSFPDEELHGWRLFAIPALGLLAGVAGLVYVVLQHGDALAVAAPAVLLALVVFRLFESLRENARRSGELSASESRFRRIIETTHEGVWVIDPEYRTTLVNPRMAEMLGYPEAEMVGRPLWDFLDQEGAREVAAMLAEKRAGQQGQIELRYKRKDGSDLWALLNTSEMLDDDGTYRGALGMHSDITERKRVEQEIRESKSRLAAAQALARLGSWEWRPVPDAVVWSEELCRIYGVEPGSAPGSYAEYLQMVHPEDRAHVQRTVGASLEDVRPWRHEFRIVRPDGTVRFLDSRADVVFDKTGAVERMLGVAQDVTERKHAELELRMRMRQQEAIARLGRAALADADLTGLMETAASIAAETLEVDEVRILELHERRDGLTLRAAGGRGVRPDPAAEESLVDQALRGINVLIEAMGSPFGLLSASGARAREFTRDDVNFLEAAANVLGSAMARERAKDLEAQVRQSQRLDSVGQLAGGIAHDFNNLLSVILNYARFTIDQVDKESPLREDIEEIRKAAERAAELTHQLLLFSRRKVVEPHVLDVNDVVADVRNLIRRAIGEHIEIEMDLFGHDLPVTLGDGQLEQILVNLAVNARDAMPDGGTLTITTDTADLDAAALPSVPFGSYVRITVADTGTGMDADVAARAFEPFFTTKAVGSGTGLGLATVYGIVKQAGGEIQLHSEPGAGTTAVVYLPAASDTSPPVDLRLDSEEPPGRGETVLLVEDEPAVRALTERLLRSHGYNVIAADRAASALELAQDRGNEVDLLLTDVVLPRVSGIELAHQLRASHPGIKTLYMSGYPGEVASGQWAFDHGTALLEKPFSVSTLLQKVRVAITGDAGRSAVRGDVESNDRIGVT